MNNAMKTNENLEDLIEKLEHSIFKVETTSDIYAKRTVKPASMATLNELAASLRKTVKRGEKRANTQQHAT